MRVKTLFFCITKIILVLRTTNAMIWKKSKNLGLLNVSSLFFFRERRLFTCDSPSTSALSAPTRFGQKKSFFSLMVKFIFLGCMSNPRKFPVYLWGKKVYNCSQCSGSGSWAGSVCFWASRIRILNYLYGRIQGSGSVSKCHAVFSYPMNDRWLCNCQSWSVPEGLPIVRK